VGGGKSVKEKLLSWVRCGGGKSVKEKLLSWVRSGEDDEEEHEVGDVKPAAQN